MRTFLFFNIIYSSEVSTGIIFGLEHIYISSLELVLLFNHNMDLLIRTIEHGGWISF